MKVRKIKARMTEMGINAPAVAEHLGIDTSTFYRKLKAEGTFTVKEVNELGKLLDLNGDELMDIFFSNCVA